MSLSVFNGLLYGGDMAPDVKQGAATPGGWAPNALPTPEQLSSWLRRCTDEERLNFAAKALQSGEEASRCFIENHAGRLHRADAELFWWHSVFSCRFRSDNLPRVGSALYGSRFVLMEEDGETADGGLRKWERT